MNSTNFITTDPTQMPYYCAECQGVYESHTWNEHLNGKRHLGLDYMDFPMYCNLCKVGVPFIPDHVNGKEHQTKLKSLEK